MKKTTVTIFIVLLGIILAATVIFSQWQTTRPDIETGILLAQPVALPQFEFINHYGEKMTRNDLMGQWSLLFTGFTSCPDICPSTISVLNILDNKLRVNGTEVKMIFLTIDPERDTHQVMASYVEFFSRSLTGVSGSLPGIERFCDEIGMSFIHIPLSADRYTIDHSGALVLIDPQARIAGYFKPPFDTDRMAGDLQTIAGQGRNIK